MLNEKEKERLKEWIKRFLKVNNKLIHIQK